MSDSRGPEAPVRHSRAAVTTLAVIAFVMVTGETLPVGLLADIAVGVHTSRSSVGLVVGWYALIAAAAGIPTTRLGASFDRRTLLVTASAVFGLGHVLTAAATNLPVLLVGRAVAGMAHGIFFTVAAPVATRLAAADRKGTAASRVVVGATSALVVGVPLTTFFGQYAGWRAAALTIAVLACVLTLGVFRLLPALPPEHRGLPRVTGGIRATLRSPGVLVVLSVTFILVLAHFSLFIYVTPYLTDQLDITGTALSLVLGGYGVAAVAGSAAGGWFGDRDPVRGIRIAVGMWLVGLVALYLATRSGLRPVAVVALLLWSGGFAIAVVSTVVAVLRRASGQRAESGNALHGIIFQVGILAGSAVGSLLVGQARLDLVPLTAACLGLPAVALVVVVGRAFARPEGAPMRRLP